MRILVNFDHRDHWSVHCRAADCKILISPGSPYAPTSRSSGCSRPSEQTQVQLDEVERDMARWGRGSTFIEVNDIGRRPPTKRSRTSLFDTGEEAMAERGSGLSVSCRLSI